MFVTAMKRKWHSVCDVLSDLPGAWCALNKYEFRARPDKSSSSMRHSRWVQNRLRGSVLSAGCMSAVLPLRGFCFPPGFCEPWWTSGEFYSRFMDSLQQFLRKLLAICGYLARILKTLFYEWREALEIV